MKFSSILLRRKKKVLSEDMIRLQKIYKEAGASCKLVGCSHLPKIKNVGFAEKRLQHDGKSILTIYPNMNYSSMPRQFLHFKPDPDTEVNPSENLLRGTPLLHSFYKSRSSIDQESIRLCRYYFEDGLRKVEPYYMCRSTRVKGLPEPMTFEAFMKRSIIDIHYQRLEHYLQHNLCSVNFRPASADTVLRNNDILLNLNHRHENPVIDQDIEIIYEDKSLLVVNKPSTIPIYPIGKVNLNSFKLTILLRNNG